MGEAQGNATQAAKAAGYRGTSSTLAVMGAQNLRNPKIQAAISARVEEDSGVADREARQRFWTATMFDAEVSMRERLIASQLLGRSQGDFVERLRVESESLARVVFTMPDNGRDRPRSGVDSPRAEASESIPNAAPVKPQSTKMANQELPKEESAPAQPNLQNRPTEPRKSNLPTTSGLFATIRAGRG